MDRMTVRAGDGTALLAPKHEEKYTMPELIDILLNCLAEYEDTGLEPEKIKACMDGLDEHRKAEADGHLMVLPCKIGAPVYYLTGNPIVANGYHFNRVESTKCVGFYFDEIGLQICLYMPHGNHGTYGYFGKTVFYTREEAEAALEAWNRGELIADTAEGGQNTAAGKAGH